MNPGAFFWLAPVLLFGVFCLLATSRSLWRAAPARLAGGLAVAGLAGAALVASLALAQATRGPHAPGALVALPWMTVGGRVLQLALGWDALGGVAATLVAVVGLIVALYAVTYLADDPRQGRFFTVLSLFAAAMLTLVLAADLLTLFLAWELVGACSYLLIGFWFERPDVPAAATKAFLTTRLADQAMLAGVLLLVAQAGSGRIAAIRALAERGHLAPGLLLIATLLLFAGAAGKSAQIPFQGWLPDAMRGPTPVSALLHSATMVAAGVFLVARLYPLFLAAGPTLSIIAWIGAGTALLGGAAALVQEDLKRTLAYSTMSQIGLMFVGLGAGSLLAGVLLLVAQGCYKALLFLAAGVVDHAVHGTAFARMGGLARRMPGTCAGFTVGAVALAGLPVTLAWPPKDPVLAAASAMNGALFGVVLLASLLTALYTGRMLGLVFLGPASAPAAAAGPGPRGLRLPVLGLAALVPLVLLANADLLGRPLSRLLTAPTPDAPLATGLALGVAVLGLTGGLAARRRWPGALVWPPLVPVASVLAGEFGLVAVYRAVAHGGLAASRALGRLDQAIFDPAATQIARGLFRLSQGAGRIDRTVFDRAAAQIATGTLAVVRASGRFDGRRVDGLVRALGQGVLALSGRVRRLQTGRIENYLLVLFVWGLSVLVLAVVLGLTAGTRP